MLGRGDLLHQRMLGRKHHERRAEQRVGPRGVDPQDVVVAVDAKIDLGALAPADPVSLHQFDRLGPVERFQLIRQPIRILRDPQHPLAQRPTKNRMIAALATALVRHFFVREHRAQCGAPVHRHLGDVRQPPAVHELAHGLLALRLDVRGNRQFLDRPRLLRRLVIPTVEQLQEDPLRPAEVVLVRRRDFAVPVVAETEHLQLPPECIDIALRRDRRVLPRLDGVLLGRQTERVPPHRVQHVEALHPLVTRDDVRRGVSFRVADMQTRPAGIGEHVEHVELRLARIEGRLTGIRLPERLVLVPVGLPFISKRLRRVLLNHGAIFPQSSPIPCHEGIKRTQ